MANGLLGSVLNILNPPSRGILNDINGSDDEDMNQIQSILTGLNAPEKQPGIAETILPAIAQAIAVAFAQDPAGALADQLRNRQVLQERERERKERVKQLGAQLQIEDILTRSRERRVEAATIRAEKRKTVADVGAEFRANQRDIQRFNRESGFQEKMTNLQFDQNRKLLGIKQFYDAVNARVQHSRTVELENLRSSNNRLEQKTAEELRFIIPLTYTKYFGVKDASEVHAKLARGEKLTAEEDAKITKAYDAMRNEEQRNKLALAHAQSARTSQSPVAKAFEFAMNKSTTNVIGYDAQGQPHELQKNMLGEFVPVDPKVKITKYANQKETFQYFFDFYSKINPEMAGFAGLFGTQTDMPDDKAKSLKLDELINKYRGEGDSDAEIAADLNNPQVQASFGFTPQLVQEALTRNKINPENTTKPIARIADPEGTAAGISQTTSSNITPAQIAERLAKDTAKFEAAKTVNYLTERLQKKVALKASKQYKNALTSKSAASMAFVKELDDDIEDLRRRLEDAYNAHPELRPK